MVETPIIKNENEIPIPNESQSNIIVITWDLPMANKPDSNDTFGVAIWIIVFCFKFDLFEVEIVACQQCGMRVKWIFTY